MLVDLKWTENYANTEYIKNFNTQDNIKKMNLKIKTYEDLVEHVREITGDDKFADDLAERIKSSTLTRQLSVLRNKSGLSEDQIAVIMHCSTESIKDLEHSRDNDVVVGHLSSYLKALNLGMEILITTPSGEIIFRYETKE